MFVVRQRESNFESQKKKNEQEKELSNKRHCPKTKPDKVLGSFRISIYGAACYSPQCLDSLSWTLAFADSHSIKKIGNT